MPRKLSALIRLPRPIGLGLSVVLCLQALASQQTRLEGTVKDQTGAPVVAAEVTLSTGSFTSTRVTDGDGRFSFDAVPSTSGTIRVRADGFREVDLKWNVAAGATLEIELAPETIAEHITVTPERTATRLSETAASVALLSRADISTTAALTLDDTLRQLPGFSLFRRSGSRTANPTSQGVSLRGVGASGASRAAVLADGIPINDPFGGWVYWGRIPRESVGRIEVVRGATSHLYGTDALGGVINLMTHEPETPVVSLEATYGNQQSANGSFFAGGRIGQLGAQLSAELFHTDGYRIVDERERGRVDTPARSEHSVIDLTLERLFSDTGRLFLRGSAFGEARQNGTPLQQNRTHIRQFTLGADWKSLRAGSVAVRLYGGTQVFDQDFTAVAADRNSETLTRSQRVPAQQIGLTSQWSRAAGSHHTLVAGFDAREVRGASDELVFAGGSLSSGVGAGGRQRTVGVFAQDLVRITSRLLATFGARVDRWRNYDGLSTTTPLAQPGPTTVSRLAARTETAFDPRVSLLVKATDNVSLIASGYRAFRAPTLNELYRSFRVGNIITSANSELRAERLAGGEAGATVAALDRKLRLRGTFFWSEITRSIANVTTAVLPQPQGGVLILRQRQNLNRVQSRGVELEGEARVSNSLMLSAGYQFVDAAVERSPITALEGLRIPQVARHNFTFQAQYIRPSEIQIGLQGRLVGAQFDDDQNLFELGRYFTLDALVSRPVGGGVELLAAAENLLDRQYTIGRTPTRTVGPGVLARFGIRFRTGSR